MESPAHSENPYRPPEADLADGPPVELSSLLRRLRSGSTGLLVVLAIITYGIYAAHYVRRQTRILNHLDANQRIRDGLVHFILVSNYLGAALLVPYSIVDSGHPIDGVSSVVDTAASISFIVWGFAARRRANDLLSARPRSERWFHGFWTFLFSPFYFNYKVNRLSSRAEDRSD